MCKFTQTCTAYDSRDVPHCEVNVAVGQSCDDAHGGLQFVSEGDKTWRVVGQAHSVPSACKLNTHRDTKLNRHIKDLEFLSTLLRQTPKPMMVKSVSPYFLTSLPCCSQPKAQWFLVKT